MRLADLEKEASKEFILERAAQFELACRRFSKHGGRLRQSIDDQFKREFDEEIAGIEGRSGIGNETVKNLRIA